MLDKLLDRIMDPIMDDYIRPALSRTTDWVKKNVALTLTLAFLVAIVAALSVGYGQGSRDGAAKHIATPAATPAPSPTPDRKTFILGGLDLAGYCDEHGYRSNYTDKVKTYCYSNVNLTEACNYDHTKSGPMRKDLTFTLDRSSDLRSGKCRDSRQDSVGGIKDMSGYCKWAFFKNKDDVDAYLNAAKSRWECRKPVDEDDVCNRQYPDTEARAREENGNWHCYRK